MTGLLTEDFPIYAQFNEGSTTSNKAKLKWEITKVSGNLDVLVTTATFSASISDDVNDTSVSGELGFAQGFDVIDVSSTGVDATVVSLSAQFSGTDIAYANIRAYSASGGITSVSGTVTLTVKAYIDNQGGVTNSVHDADEWYVTQTVTLIASSNIPVTTTLTPVSNGDTLVTVSSVVSGLNVANLNGEFFLSVTAEGSTAARSDRFIVASSDPEKKVQGQGRPGAYLASNSGVVSQSWATNGISESTTISASLRYFASQTPGAQSAASTFSAGVLVGAAAVTSFTGTNGVDTIDAYVVQGANAVETASGDNYDIRPNQSYTIKVRTLLSAASVSKAVSIAVTTNQSLATGSAMVAVGSQAASTTLPTAMSLTTAAGDGSLALTTTGFAADKTITISVSVNDVTDVLTLTTRDVDYALTGDYAMYLTSPGTAVNMTFQVKDQWGEYPASTETLRLQVTKQAGSGGFYYATTNSQAAVTGGKATVAFTPEPATKTGSASVLVALEKFNSTLNSYVATSDTVTTTVNVSSATNAFDGAGLASSYSVSVSYWPNTTSWVVVSGSTANTGSMVVASGAGLIFSDYTGASTGSGTLAIRAGNNGNYSFSVSGQLAGTYTMTVTNGSATTTSLIIVDPASYSAGTAITFDTTSIAAGRTKIVTGKVVDMNGNPIDTTGNATIVVTYTGTAGVPVGSMPTETDANGEFKVSILTTAADTGTFTLTAVYLKDGANTATAAKVTAAQAITVGAGDAVASDDTKVNAGSFKGYVAVYAKGYEGKRLSAKVGKDWVVVASLASNFERVVEFTGAGYTIAVRIYIDRVLVDTITVTTK